MDDYHEVQHQSTLDSSMTNSLYYNSNIMIDLLSIRELLIETDLG